MQRHGRGTGPGWPLSAGCIRDRKQRTPYIRLSRAKFLGHVGVRLEQFGAVISRPAERPLTIWRAFLCDQVTTDFPFALQLRPLRSLHANRNRAGCDGIPGPADPCEHLRAVRLEVTRLVIVTDANRDLAALLKSGVEHASERFAAVAT